MYFLWIERLPNFFFSDRASKTLSAGAVDVLSRPASLDSASDVRKIHRFTAFPLNIFWWPTQVPANVHRFEQSLGGRSYLIEVAPVGRNRWRAYIVRKRGVPTALMPFYGSTPQEAARELSDWIARVHQRAGKPGGTV